MTTNNYILAQWRDAISDPPDELFRRVPAIIRDGTLVTACVYNNAKGPRWTDPVIKWLDITTIPGVPREAVQAAVDEMQGKADTAALDTPQEIAAVGIRGSIGCIAHHTGVMPTEVQ